MRVSAAQLQQARVLWLWRPFTPNVLLRGAAPGVTGLMSSGWFGGGINNNLSNFGMRNDMDLQVLWELRNMGFGNRALVREKEAENRLAVLDVLRVEQPSRLSPWPTPIFTWRSPITTARNFACIVR